MSQPRSVEELAHRIAIQDLLTHYCTAIDSMHLDKLDEVFTPDAHIDYTSAGGVKGTFPEVKVWLQKALSLFPTTQHLVANFEITIDGDQATSRCMFYNPMTLPVSQEENADLRVLYFGGYYNDELILTPEGWRIRQCIEDTAWTDATFPEGMAAPE
jgi:hypothetical protein